MIMSGPSPRYSAVGCGSWLGGPAAGVTVRPRRGRRRGLGQACMSGADISAAIGPPGVCGPYDTTCIICNTQQANAVSDLVDSGCIPPGTPISFSCDTSAAAVNSFYSGNPAQPGATVGGTYIPAPAPVTAQNPGAAAQQPTAAEIANCPSLIFYNGVCANPATPAQTVVNPSPPSQNTGGSTTGQNPASTNSQANGGSSGSTTTTSNGGSVTSTVQGYINDLTSGTDLIPGIPNWVLFAGGVLIAAALIQKKW